MNFDISWPLAILSITGTIFNVKKKVACFYIWAFGEIFWIALDYKNGQFGRMFLDFVHLGMAIWGIYTWGKEAKDFESRKSKNRKTKSRKI